MTSSAFLELQRLVRHMTEELAGFRRRAIQAEARVRELEHALATAEARAATGTEPAARGGAAGRAETGPTDGEQLDLLARENVSLRQRLDGATERTRQLLDRVRFLRQQQEQEAAR